MTEGSCMRLCVAATSMFLAIQWDKFGSCSDLAPLLHPGVLPLQILFVLLASTSFCKLSLRDAGGRASAESCVFTIEDSGDFFERQILGKGVRFGRDFPAYSDFLGSTQRK